MKSLTIITLFVFVFGAAATSSLAGNMHFGAGIGNTFFSSDYNDALDNIKNIDENSTAWKIFGGFSGSEFFGLEGGYRDFGGVESTISGDVFKSSTTGWDVEALGRFQIAMIDVFGKAGVMFWSSNFTILKQEYKDTGTDFFWGLGAGARLGPIGVRLEWESLEGGAADNLSMVSLGATLGF